MKFHLRNAAIALALAAGVGVAAAQSTSSDTQLQLSDAQKQQIYQSLATEMPKSSGRDAAPAPAGVSVRVGAALPQTVTLLDMPPHTVKEVPAMAAYKFALFGDQVAIVEPGSRQIVEILQEK